MNTLVIGSGGREHAVIKSLAASPLIKKIFSSPGNAGISELAEVVQLEIKNHLSVIDFCNKNNITFIFIGPEDPLVDGLADSLRNENFHVFGPSKEAAKLEGSKIFAKEFMLEAMVPTAQADIVESVTETLLAAKNKTAPYILKADGLAAGKGVFICKNTQELETAAIDLFNKKILGAAGSKALLEQNLAGKEISFLVLTDGAHFQALPLAQDHKRLLNNNLGPNTGGMGTVAPVSMNDELYQKIITKIVTPSINNLKKRNYLFRGVLFIGLMIVDDEPYVLEYNVRFGDPETQVILPLIENDIAELFFNLAKGQLNQVHFNEKTAFCIVNAAGGYPNISEKNISITLPKNNNDTYILHAGTAFDSQQKIVASGGRVLNIISVNSDFKNAKTNAYKLNSEIIYQGRQFRTDIGDYV